jgi:hypothetical protein
MRQYHEMVFWRILYSWLIHRILFEEKKLEPWLVYLMDRRLTICIHHGVQTWESPLPFLWQPPPTSLNTVLLNSERMGHSARPPALLDVSPRLYKGLATHRQPYYFSTHNADLTLLWSYETFFVIETVIDRYLAVETWEGLNKLIIMIYTQHNN